MADWNDPTSTKTLDEWLQLVREARGAIEVHRLRGVLEVSHIIGEMLHINDNGEIEMTQQQIDTLLAKVPIVADRSLAHTLAGIPVRRIEPGDPDARDA